jgi:hypothetical protein
VASGITGGHVEWAEGPDDRSHAIETFTEAGSAFLRRSSAHQVTVDRRHIGWARDGDELAALLDRVRKAIASGWTPDAGDLPDER